MTLTFLTDVFREINQSCLRNSVVCRIAPFLFGISIESVLSFSTFKLLGQTYLEYWSLGINMQHIKTRGRMPYGSDAWCSSRPRQVETITKPKTWRFIFQWLCCSLCCFPQFQDSSSPFIESVVPSIRTATTNPHTFFFQETDIYLFRTCRTQYPK